MEGGDAGSGSDDSLLPAVFGASFSGDESLDLSDVPVEELLALPTDELVRALARSRAPARCAGLPTLSPQQTWPAAAAPAHAPVAPLQPLRSGAPEAAAAARATPATARLCAVRACRLPLPMLGCWLRPEGELARSSSLSDATGRAGATSATRRWTWATGRSATARHVCMGGTQPADGASSHALLATALPAHPCAWPA